MTEECKKCTDCGIVRPFSEFYRAKYGEGGRRKKCKQCFNLASRLRWEETKDKVKAVQADYRANNKAKIAIKQAKWHANNKDRENQRRLAWGRANPEKRRAAVKRHYEAMPLEVRREKSRRQYARIKHDPAYRLRASVSQNVRRSLVTGKGGRSVMEMLGYSMAELRLHLERQFQKGMSWANYGEWHIDHIIPISALRAESPDDPKFRRAWAITNLRPMWAKENIRKGGKVLTLL